MFNCAVVNSTVFVCALLLHDNCIMPPSLKKLVGHIAFGLFGHPSVHHECMDGQTRKPYVPPASLKMGAEEVVGVRDRLSRFSCE